MINVLGTIEWNKPSGMKDFLNDNPDLFGGFYPFKWGGEVVGEDEAILYTYNIDTTINTDLSQLPASTEQICFCIFRIVHCRQQQNVQMPFLEYLLYLQNNF